MSVYACGDLHGSWSYYDQINNFIREGDKVYLLGNCIDMTWSLVRTIATNPKFRLLKGCCEDAFVRAALGEKIEADEVESLFRPRGMIDGWIKEGSDERWIDYFKNLKTFKAYINDHDDMTVLTHAGYSPPRQPDEYDLLHDELHIYEPWIANQMWKGTYIIHSHTECEKIDPNWDIDEGALFYANGHKIALNTGKDSKERILFNLDTFDSVHFERI